MSEACEAENGGEPAYEQALKTRKFSTRVGLVANKTVFSPSVLGKSHHPCAGEQTDKKQSGSAKALPDLCGIKANV